jgi:dGTPase
MTALEAPYDANTVDFAKDSEAKLVSLEYRLHEEALHGGKSDVGPGSRHRNEFWRDYARILYSSSFRRLQGKMQLLGVSQTGFFRNRLTHSFEVAQIARGIASKLELGNPLVVEACSIAHDLGNPPFGHAGESVLSDEVGEDLDAYEGNAQTLRTLMRLEKKIPEHGGLNLTLRTLLGVVKYDRRGLEGGTSAEPKSSHPKYVYVEDYDKLHEELGKVGAEELADGAPIRTIDMQVMDLADEIAYAAHDLEDCLAAGLFTIDELMHEFAISGRNNPGGKDDFSGGTEKLKEEVDRCREFAGKATRLKSSEEYAFLFRKELTSALVNRLIKDISVVSTENGRKLGYRSDSKLARGLKKLVFKAVLRRPDVHLYEKQGEKVIKGLFEVYTDMKYNDELRLLPPEYR